MHFTLANTTIQLKMMDAYSDIPGPTKAQAIQEMENYFDSDHGYIEFVRKTSQNICNMEVMKKCIQSVINAKDNHEGAFGSYSGWVVFFRRDLIDEILKEYQKSLQL